MPAPVGFALIATVTGIGGGTLRDLLLGENVFWIYQSSYVGLCALVAAIVYIAAPHIGYRYRLLLWADAVGLSLFCLWGARVAVESGFSGLIAITERHFRRLDSRCAMQRNTTDTSQRNLRHCGPFWGLVYITFESLALPYNTAELGGIRACFVVRAFGLNRGLSLPSYRPRVGRQYPTDDKTER